MGSVTLSPDYREKIGAMATRAGRVSGIYKWIGAAAMISMLFSGGARGNSEWKTVKNGDFTVFYGPGHGGDALLVLQAMDDAKAYVIPWTGSLALGVPVTIEDAGLYTQGFADPVYYRLHLFSSPPFIKDLFATEDWWELVAVHEYTHLSHMTFVRGPTKILTIAFGRVLSPNIYSPTWLTEGLATNVESTISPYQGRLNDGFFDAYILARARDGRLPSLEQASPGLMEFPGGSGPYLYGSEFLLWLSRSRGGAGFPRFVYGNGGRILSLLSPVWPWVGVDLGARQVWREGFPGLWKKWQAEVTAQSASFFIDGERLTSRGWYVSDLVVEGNRLLYRRSYPVKTAAFSGFQFDEIIERDLATGREKVLRTGLPVGMSRMKPVGGKIWFATEELGRNYSNTFLRSFGYEALIHEYDPATGRDRVVIRDRARCFTVLADGRILLSRDRRDGFGSELVAVDPVSRQRDILFASDLLVDEMVSDGVRVVATARGNRENFSIFLLDIGKKAFVPLVRTPFLEGTPVLDGERVLFTANYGKTYSAYCVDIVSGRVERLTGGGFAAYAARAGDWLYFVGLNSAGFDLYRKKYEPVAFNLPADLPAERMPSAFDAKSVKYGGYGDNLATLLPEIQSPFYGAVYDSKNAMTRELYGITLAGLDTVGDFPGYQASFGYDRMVHRGIFFGDITSQFYEPWMFMLAGGNLDGKELSASAEYPLWVSLSPGLAGLSAGVSVDYFDDFSRRQVTPFEQMTFSFPQTRLGMSLILPQERRGWGGEANGSSVYLLSQLVQYLPGSQFSLLTMAFQNSGDVATSLAPVRGYGSKLETASGAVISADYTRPVLKIGKGLWNPTLYFEDLIAGVFVDAITPTGGKAPYSYGAELHLETWVTNMGVPLDWGVQVASNREGETSWAVMAFVNATQIENGLWKLPLAVRGAVRAMGGLIEPAGERGRINSRHAFK